MPRRVCRGNPFVAFAICSLSHVMLETAKIACNIRGRQDRSHHDGQRENRKRRKKGNPAFAIY